eukprot:310208-Hanusia_phi.AAC.1
MEGGRGPDRLELGESLTESRMSCRYILFSDRRDQQLHTPPLLLPIALQPFFSALHYLFCMLALRTATCSLSSFSSRSSCCFSRSSYEKSVENRRCAF